MKFTYNEINDAANPPSGFAGELASSVQDAVCGMYHEYIGFYNKNINLAAPAGKLLETFWNNACPLEPPYSPPPAPFTGGQCNQWYSFIYKNSDGQTVDSRVQGWGIKGAVKSVSIQQLPSGYSAPFHLSYFMVAEGTAADDMEQMSPGKYKFQLNYAQYGVPSFSGLKAWNPNNNSQVVPDNCGNPPSPDAIVPPPKIDKDITLPNGGNPITIPISIKPQISLPDFSLNVNAPIFIPTFSPSFNPQFKINPQLDVNFQPKININFSPDGININLGDGDNYSDPITNIVNNNNANNVNNNINNVNNNVNNVNNNVNNVNNNVNKTKDDVSIIKDKLACNPCDLLEEIKEKLFKVPTYRGVSVPEFQSIKLDNLADLGFIEIDLTVQPTKTKIIFGGNAPNVMFAGWITWRKNHYNFAREQVTAEKSIYLAPKGANGFSMCCAHKSRASLKYYIEIKD